jgi:uncharacterized protein
MATSEDALTMGRKAPLTGVQQLFAAHPLTSYFTLAILGTWLLQVPMIVSADGLGLFQFHVPFALFAALFILSSYTGPTLGAVLVTNALEGRAGVAHFFRRYALWRVGIVPYLLVFFLFPVLSLAAIATQLGPATWQALAAHPGSFFTTYLPAVLIFPAIITWGEEPGWRGFALTRMQARYHPALAALVVGLVHSIWHLPNFLMIGGPNAAGPFNLANFAANTAVIIALTFIFSWIFNNARQSILIAVLAHASFNATGAWLNSIMKAPSAAGPVAYALFGVVALVIVVATRGRLGYDDMPSAPALPVAEATASD